MITETYYNYSYVKLKLLYEVFNYIYWQNLKNHISTNAMKS